MPVEDGGAVGWECIETFFKETRYPRARHCITSYDEFLEHGLPETVAAANPLILAQDGHRLQVSVGPPTLVLGKMFAGTPDERVMLPNEARMLDKTYGADLYADLTCSWTQPGKDGSGQYVLERVKLGSLPVMLHSKACALRGLTPEELAASGECPFDEGGYHVIEGGEKIVTSRDASAMNRLLVERIEATDPRYAKVRLEGRVFCRPHGSLFPRKVVLTVAPDGSLSVTLSMSRSLRVRSELTLPLFTAFRLCGLETDGDIMDAVLSFCVGLERADAYEMLRPSATRAKELGHTHAAAMAHVRSALAVGQPLRVAEAEAALRGGLFPNASSDVHLHLARATAEMLGYAAGRPLPDRDALHLKRVESPGAKIADMFRDVYAEMTRLTLQALTREWNDTRAQSVPVSGVVVRQTAPRIVQSAVLTDLMRRALRGKWLSPSPGALQQEGVVHTLPRASIHAALAYQSRVTNPAPATLKRREPRMLRGDQWGYLCAVHTPDGNNVGLVKQLAMFAEITPRSVDVLAVVTALTAAGVVALSGDVPDGETPVTLDGTLVGFCVDPRALREDLVSRRRAGTLSHWVSVHWIAGVSSEVSVSTDGGRLSRPLLVVARDGSFSRTGGFSQLLPAAIEYVDVHEIDCCRVAVRPDDIVPGMTTHLELHASAILSPVSLLTPFSDHNAAARNIFSCKQTTACASLYASNLRSRADAVNILHHSQVPLVSTRYGTLLGGDDMPHGENAIVAVMTYTGSNQEDAVILNAAAVQRGLFHTTHLDVLTCDEESAEGALDRFAHPVSAGVFELRAEGYAGIDAGGLPVPGSEISPGEAIVGKVRKQPGSGLVVDTSLVAGPTEHGVVDRVVLVPLNRGQRRCKIRVRDFREPTVGDKFASRHGQKGVVGRLLAEADMPFSADDGVMPDIVMNPHAFPSRMTVGHLLEAACAKATVFDGVRQDATPFMLHDMAAVSARLSGFGDANCDVVMSAGTNGVQHGVPTFFAPTYYMRLKQQVADKVAATRVARKTAITHQPAQGRANGGGMRLGEMERDALLGNGLCQFIKETLVERSDRPARPTRIVGGVPVGSNRLHGTWDRPDDTAATTDVFSAELPAAMTALMSELGAMCIGATLSRRSG